jgi:hypothetical protein
MNALRNRHFSFLLAAFFIVFMACSSDREPLNVSQMKKIFWDLARTEEYVNNYLVLDSSINIKAEKQRRFAAVYALHSTTEEKFLKSIAYYKAEPKQFRKLIDSLNIYATRLRESSFADTTETESKISPIAK